MTVDCHYELEDIIIAEVCKEIQGVFSYFTFVPPRLLGSATTREAAGCCMSHIKGVSGAALTRACTKDCTVSVLRPNETLASFIRLP